MNLSALGNRAVAAMRNYFNRGYDTGALLDFTGGTPIICRCLAQLYRTLFWVSMGSASGAFLCVENPYGQLCFALVACYWFMSFLLDEEDQERKGCLLAYCGFFLWLCLAPWFNWFFGVDDRFVVGLMLGASASFHCLEVSFCGAHLFLRENRRRFALGFCYLRGAAGTWLMMIIGLIFGYHYLDHSDSTWWIDLISFMILAFKVYVVAYSQEVVVRARAGDVAGQQQNHATLALQLYTHFPSFVVHVIRGFWN